MTRPIRRDPLGSESALAAVDDATSATTSLDDTAILRLTETELPAFVFDAPPEPAADVPQPAFDLIRTGRIAIAWLALAVVINVASYALLSLIRHAAMNGTVTGHTLYPADLWGWLQVFLPLGAVGVGAVCLAFEAWGIGWERSALRRLLHPATNSTRTDLFYLFLVVSGLRGVLTFLFTLGAGLGAGYWISARIQELLGVSLLSEVSFPLSLAIVTLVNTFTFYWVHRIMHSRFLWEIHKVHHAAEEMNVITPHRNHPVDHAVVLAVNAVPAAMLGASEIGVLTYVAMNGVYQQMAHTDMDWNLRRWGLGWIEKYVLFSSTAHRIHHSRSRRHFDKNFGITPFWDRLFGTYYEPRGEPVRVGLDQEAEHNTGHPVRELWRVYWGAVRTAAGELARLFRRPRSEDRRA
ncbi:MAG: sterol desaturase family protein [Planctomycetales bacterium]